MKTFFFEMATIKMNLLKPFRKKSSIGDRSHISYGDLKLKKIGLYIKHIFPSWTKKISKKSENRELSHLWKKFDFLYFFPIVFYKKVFFRMFQVWLEAFMKKFFICIAPHNLSSEIRSNKNARHLLRKFLQVGPFMVQLIF